ncbi:MAG: hypothetical protein SV186_05440 [Candidatus Nanohaloarchaea archaeon]|nr:hypothetical protein [Candidatus Nanohaloarchaea archaeon]
MSDTVHVSREEYDGLKRTIAILGDDDALQMIEASEQAIEEGRTTTLDQLRKELG